MITISTREQNVTSKQAEIQTLLLQRNAVTAAAARTRPWPRRHVAGGVPYGYDDYIK